MLNRTLATGLLVATGVAGALAAHAADMPGLFAPPSYQDPEPPTQFEFGTGWYLRGDVTATNDVEPDILGTLPTRGNRRDWDVAGGGGAGYKFNDFFRVDVTGDYLGVQRRSGTDAVTGVTSTARLERWDGLVNGYVDFGNWYGLTPYIGAGVGVAGLSSSGSFTLPGAVEATNVGRADKYNFAWAAMAGVSYHLAPHLMLDVGYRYLDLGRYAARTTGARTDLDSHEVRVGVRYQID